MEARGQGSEVMQLTKAGHCTQRKSEEWTLSAEQDALAREKEAKDAEQHGPVPRAHCGMEMTYRETSMHMCSFILATTNWGAHNLKVKWI